MMTPEPHFARVTPWKTYLQLQIASKRNFKIVDNPLSNPLLLCPSPTNSEMLEHGTTRKKFTLQPGDITWTWINPMIRMLKGSSMKLKIISANGCIIWESLWNLWWLMKSLRLKTYLKIGFITFMPMNCLDQIPKCWKTSKDNREDPRRSPKVLFKKESYKIITKQEIETKIFKKTRQSLLL